MGTYLNNGTVLEKEGDKIGTVGGDTDILLASLALALREISCQPSLGVLAFAS